MTTTTTPKTLAEVKVGDRVILVMGGRHNGEPRPEIVKAVTDKRIQAGHSYRDTWFDKATGVGMVGCGWQFPRKIRLPEPGELEAFDSAEADAKAAKKAIADAKSAHEATEPHRLASRIGWTEHETLEKVSVNRLRQIAAWLDEVK
jgi:hypothetical protein